MNDTFDTNAYIRTIITFQSRDDISKEELKNNLKVALLLNDKKSEFIRMSFIPMLYIDAYKILKFRLKNGLSTEAEYQMISILDKVEEMEEFNKILIGREDYLSYSIGCVETVNNTPYLGKIRMMKSLSEDENCRLSDLTELHKNDIEKYDIDINEDFLYKYFKDYSMHLVKENVSYSPDKILEALAGFLQNTYIKNGEDIYEIVSRLNETVYTHIDDLKKVYDTDYRYIDILTEDYFKDKEEFNEYALYECPLLVDSLSLYVLMRDRNILGNDKVLKNERNE